MRAPPATASGCPAARLQATRSQSCFATTASDRGRLESNPKARATSISVRRISHWVGSKEVAALLRLAFETTDMDLFGSLLAPDVRWGPLGCSNPDQVIAQYRQSTDLGFRGTISAAEAPGDDTSSSNSSTRAPLRACRASRDHSAGAACRRRPDRLDRGLSRHRQRGPSAGLRAGVTP
jgi:hypothetical protein